MVIYAGGEHGAAGSHTGNTHSDVGAPGLRYCATEWLTRLVTEGKKEKKEKKEAPSGNGEPQ